MADFALYDHVIQAGGQDQTVVYSATNPVTKVNDGYRYIAGRGSENMQPQEKCKKHLGHQICC